jgi:hypothetical protein
MGAPAPPVETPPAAAPESPPVAEPDTPASPAPGDQPAPEPGKEPEPPPELSLLDIASDPDLLKKAIEAGVKPADIHAAIREQEADTGAEEKIRAEAQRIREQEREAEQAVQNREQAFTAADQVGRRNARWLLDVQAQTDADPDAVLAALAEKITSQDGAQRSKFATALDAVYSGAIASTTLGFERTIQGVMAEYKDAIGTLPADKQAEIVASRYQFAMKGDAGPLLKNLFAAVRAHGAADGAAKGEAKGEKKAEATKASIEMLAKLREAGVLGAPRVNGAAPAESRPDAELLADPNTPVSKLVEIRRRQRGG